MIALLESVQVAIEGVNPASLNSNAARVAVAQIGNIQGTLKKCEELASKNAKGKGADIRWVLGTGEVARGLQASLASQIDALTLAVNTLTLVQGSISAS